uniref:beta-fructofuranosidase n=1 Tax=Oryza sativa TaxID=4530 RepID=Q94C07_ORYSA|nr:soluble acid invertase bfruct3 [Oryza sativa Japonica Group]
MLPVAIALEPTSIEDEGAGVKRPIILISDPKGVAAGVDNRRPPASPSAIFVVVSVAIILVALAASVIATQTTWSESNVPVMSGEAIEPGSVDIDLRVSKGVSEGVSYERTTAVLDVQAHTAGNDFAWTNIMLTWQRTTYHFQPAQNWMNDPNGPLYYKGWYHLFYQWNPDTAVWGNKISWGHAVSKDLLHWHHLPIAMVPDNWYDLNGVWSGSATDLPDGKLMMLYTGSTVDQSVQDQNLADPVNITDPLLRDWVKTDVNPVLYPPPGIGAKDFRDPTTAFKENEVDDKRWRAIIGSKEKEKVGLSVVYKTDNFSHFRPVPVIMHRVPGTGMWECVDFYPVSTVADVATDEGSDSTEYSVPGIGVKHVLKSRLDDDKDDYKALGTYFAATGTFAADDADLDVGIGLRLDYGKCYAARTFYNQNKQRRILWGWIGETELEAVDLMKGWASLQAIPRTMVFDEKTGTNVLQRPEEEVESWSLFSTNTQGVVFEPGSVVPSHVTGALQLDITASFDVDETLLEITSESHDAGCDCSNSGGAGTRGSLGPFGLLVVAEEKLSELTPVYLYVAKGGEGRAKAHLCICQTRSSMASGVDKEVYGSAVPVLDGENYSARILVDHSIVESFAQAGRTCVRSRDYPTKDTYGAARWFFFNNATEASVRASLKAWQMKSFIRPYPVIPDQTGFRSNWR